jgi:DNA-binding NtrC family response regulator
VLETRRVRRLGALVERPIDVRLIAATNRDLAAEVEAGRFRRDLYYRLAAATVVVPPLRERPLDLPILARTFLAEVCWQRGLPEGALSPGALRRLQLHAWPGNVRELKNAIQFAAEISDGDLIEARHLPESVGAEVAPWMLRELAGAEEGQRIPLYQEVRELEARRIREALVACEGVRVRTAERLGIPLRTLVTKIKEYGLQSYRRAERSAR